MAPTGKEKEKVSSRVGCLQRQDTSYYQGVVYILCMSTGSQEGDSPDPARRDGTMAQGGYIDDTLCNNEPGRLNM